MVNSYPSGGRIHIITEAILTTRQGREEAQYKVDTTQEMGFTVFRELETWADFLTELIMFIHTGHDLESHGEYVL